MGHPVKNSIGRWLFVGLTIATLSSSVVSQKVRTGYDKGINFKIYKSYTWSAPEVPVTRPLLYAGIIEWVDLELKARGYTRVDHGGDLTLIPAGGMDFAVNTAAGTPILPTYGGPPPSIDATRWTGAAGAAYAAAGSYVPEGTFALTFVDRASNKIVWNGTVREKLDIANKQKSLDRVHKAVVKLVKKFPPRT
jgi:Domain of unknown function (DUF4136)